MTKYPPGATVGRCVQWDPLKGEVGWRFSHMRFRLCIYWDITSSVRLNNCFLSSEVTLIHVWNIVFSPQLWGWLAFLSREVFVDLFKFVDIIPQAWGWFVAFSQVGSLLLEKKVLFFLLNGEVGRSFYLVRIFLEVLPQSVRLIYCILLISQ